MMKLGYIVNMGLATVLVVPAVTLQDTKATDLRSALSETVRALESLTEIEQRIATGDPSSVGDILERTAAANSEAREQDKLLTELRGGVSRLQQTLDELLAGPSGTSPAGQAGGSSGVHQSGGVGPEPARDTRTGTDTVVHTGLSDSQLEVIGSIRPPVESRGSEVLRGTPKRFEPEGFSADPVLHGRAYYRAGRYAEGLTLLQTVEDDVNALYWSARCHEKLSHPQDAIAVYRRVIEDPQAGYLAERSRLDIEFLEWKLRFESQSAKRRPQRRPEGAE